MSIFHFLQSVTKHPLSTTPEGVKPYSIQIFLGILCMGIIMATLSPPEKTARILISLLLALFMIAVWGSKSKAKVSKEKEGFQTNETKEEKMMIPTTTTTAPEIEEEDNDTINDDKTQNQSHQNDGIITSGPSANFKDGQGSVKIEKTRDALIEGMDFSSSYISNPDNIYVDYGNAKQKRMVHTASRNFAVPTRVQSGNETMDFAEEVYGPMMGKDKEQFLQNPQWNPRHTDPSTGGPMPDNNPLADPPNEQDGGGDMDFNDLVWSMENNQSTTAK